MLVLESDRLNLFELEADHGPFILKLTNDQSFIKNIGNRGIKTIADAEGYILRAGANPYKKYGYGLYLVELKSTGEPIGICGLVKRDNLEHPDIGFAFLPQFCNQGYGEESSRAVLVFSQIGLKLSTVLAVTSPQNVPSIKLLEKIGFKFRKHVKLSEGTPESLLYDIDLKAAPRM